MVEKAVFRNNSLKYGLLKCFTLIISTWLAHFLPKNSYKYDIKENENRFHFK